MATKKELFAQYLEQDKGVDAARVALEKAMADRSNTVKSIQAQFGEGPYQLPSGELIKVSKRQSKDDTGAVTGTTWFFKTMGSKIDTIE